jgi:hypothetical protein
MRAARTLSSPPEISAIAFLLKKSPHELPSVVYLGSNDESSDNFLEDRKIPEAYRKANQ